MTDTELFKALWRGMELKSQLGYTSGIPGHYDHDTTKAMINRVHELGAAYGYSSPPVAYRHFWNGDMRYTQFYYGYLPDDMRRVHMLVDDETAQQRLGEFIP